MESNRNEKRKRPVWVWVISILFFLSAASTLFSYYLIASGKIPLSPTEKAYLESLTSVDITISILIGLINLIGAVNLFLLRKQAFYFFLSAFILNVAVTVWQILNKGFVEAMQASGLIGMLIGWGILVVVCVYTKKLEKSGILK